MIFVINIGGQGYRQKGHERHKQRDCQQHGGDKADGIFVAVEKQHDQNASHGYKHPNDGVDDDFVRGHNGACAVATQRGLGEREERALHEKHNGQAKDETEDHVEHATTAQKQNGCQNGGGTQCDQKAQTPEICQNEFEFIHIVAEDFKRRDKSCGHWCQQGHQNARQEPFLKGVPFVRSFTGVARRGLVGDLHIWTPFCLFLIENTGERHPTLQNLSLYIITQSTPVVNKKRLIAERFG